VATAKKPAAKVAATLKSKTPVKATQTPAKLPAKKATVSKSAKAIARINISIGKLTERKAKITAEINTLRDQRAALKVSTPAPAPVAASVPSEKATAKTATPAKKPVKPAAKK
jgi:hypothetical protein